MTENEQLSPGQRQTRSARLARRRKSEERRAEYLRERGWICTPPPDPDTDEDGAHR